MKLTGLYIENFGGLHHYTLNFGAELTTVMEPNGFGKTTLAEFIRAMFYGFPRKSKTLDKSRRQKYTPWSGGQFGGNLTFEYEGQQYRVERTFGANPKSDTFTVIDLGTNRKTNRFSEELGQELFGLDADSFERSTYLPQVRDSGSLATASIQAKLSNLVEDGSDVAGFDKAVAALKASRSAIIPYRGSGGSAAESASEITRLQLQLDALRSQEKQMEASQEAEAELRREMERIKEALSQTGGQLKTASQQERAALRQQQYLQLQNRHRKVSERLQFYKKKYPRGLPQEDALRRAELAAERLNRYEDPISGEEAVVSAGQLENCRRLCKAYDDLQRKVHDMQRNRADLEQQVILHAAAKSGNFKIPAVMMILAVSCMIAGALLEWIYGAIALGVGVLALVSGIVVLCMQRGKYRRQRQAAEKKLADLHRQIDAAKGEGEKYRREIAAFLARAGLPAEPWQYAEALEALERRRERRIQRDEAASADRKELQLFFADLGLLIEQDIHTGLEQLRQDIREVQSAQILIQELEEQLAAMEEACGDILYAERSAMLDPQQLRLEEQRLHEELTMATTRMLQVQQKVQQLREEIAQIPDVLERLEQARQRLAEDREKADILDAAMDFLQQARENLATSYMGTIRARFGHYLAMLGGGDETYFVDTDLQIYLERQGHTRELAYFSAGQTDLVMLCMRLSLADALFGGQEMFLVLDDPFVNLDDSHTEQARLLLRKLASTRQILYLSCHSSRAI